MKKYKLLIFDWDGTLVDSVSLIVECVKITAQQLNLSLPSEIAIRQNIGRSLYALATILFPTAEPILFEQIFFSHYTEDKLAHSFFPQSMATLQFLKNKGYILAVATNKPRALLDDALQRADLVDFFAMTHCPEDGFAKPHPWMILDITEKLGIALKDVVMIGDTIYDMQFAQNAGVAAIAVTYGSHTREQLTAYVPTAIIDNIQELIFIPDI